MTNGHWARQDREREQAKLLYAQGKIQEADYLLGKQLHEMYVDGEFIDYVPVNEREALGLVTDIDGNISKKKAVDVIVSASETSTWYYVKKPSGTCVRTKLTPSSVEKAKGLGWIVSLTDICEEESTPTQTPPILSSQVQKIIDDWHNHQLILPSWFANNNLNWVISGHITESEFLKGFNALLHEQIAYYVADHHPVEEPDVPEVPVEEVPVETTADIPPPTTEEPEQMEFLCSDVYTLDNGSVVKTNYPTLSVPQIQNFISQGLMVRDCGTPSPTVNEVRSHYGYTVEEAVRVPVGPEVTVPTEKFVVSKPGRLTMSDMTNTNAWVGVLIAGTLAVPVFSSILSKRK